MEFHAKLNILLSSSAVFEGYLGLLLREWEKKDNVSVLGALLEIKAGNNTLQLW